jgi:hypothetical protein
VFVCAYGTVTENVYETSYWKILQNHARVIQPCYRASNTLPLSGLDPKAFESGYAILVMRGSARDVKVIKKNTSNTALTNRDGNFCV